MKRKYDIVAITGTYTDRDGNEKKEYTNIGVVLEGDKGLSIKLKTVPVGWDGWANCYEPKEQDQKPAGRGQQRRGSSDFDDGNPPF